MRVFHQQTKLTWNIAKVQCGQQTLSKSVRKSLIYNLPLCVSPYVGIVTCHLAPSNLHFTTRSYIEERIGASNLAAGREQLHLFWEDFLIFCCFFFVGIVVGKKILRSEAELINTYSQAHENDWRLISLIGHCGFFKIHLEMQDEARELQLFFFFFNRLLW